MAIAAVLTNAIYIWGVRSQGGFPAWWAFAVICAIAIGAAVSSRLNQRRVRRFVLIPCTVVAAVLGAITLTSIGGALIITAALGVVSLATDSS